MHYNAYAAAVKVVVEWTYTAGARHFVVLWIVSCLVQLSHSGHLDRKVLLDISAVVYKASKNLNISDS